MKKSNIYLNYVKAKADGSFALLKKLASTGTKPQMQVD
jgi:hypothetical protein